jgi:hypothetical protein
MSDAAIALRQLHAAFPQVVKLFSDCAHFAGFNCFMQTFVFVYKTCEIVGLPGRRLRLVSIENDVTRANMVLRNSKSDSAGKSR